MAKYYTSIEISDNGYVGIVYNQGNQQVYKTLSYPSQSQVTKDINNFLKSGKASQEQPTVPSTSTTPSTIQNTIRMQPSTRFTRTGRCCGR